mmetsp:Transcript_42138/g.91842  ORF Transcript_42138/g.91842 Transcript_42138/m.91842 type:complete len:105 (+) Transcript_42138:62-376(+)|eukprot:CAMPEP_0170596270 /NCGR_PEP_ID=MMETSP0224-20130122/15019_1 /TAXON_ID=285029 /ORGANISM="Togula jolla, Strain CCCM 725" /LENGTH=104 /DNA_ID=CAMNT_0010920533 /DNA_START=43 /DNA_END=357 /DNA_ORIENTATION=+
MAQRNASCLLALALLATAWFALPAPSSFIAAGPPSTASAQGRSTLAQGLRLDSRSLQVSANASGDSTPPGKINLLYIGLLAGTAAIGLLAVFFYGSYSGAGSSL